MIELFKTDKLSSGEVLSESVDGRVKEVIVQVFLDDSGEGFFELGSNINGFLLSVVGDSGDFFPHSIFKIVESDYVIFSSNTFTGVGEWFPRVRVHSADGNVMNDHTNDVAGMVCVNGKLSFFCKGEVDGEMIIRLRWEE